MHSRKKLYLFLLSLIVICASVCFVKIVFSPAQPAKKDSSIEKYQWPKYKVEAKASVPKGNSGFRIEVSSYWINDRLLPYDLLLIDPQGRRLGCDGKNGKKYTEITNGIYEKIFSFHDDGTEFPIIYILIQQPILGNYTLRIYCKETDFYYLSVEGKDIYNGYGLVVFENIASYKNKIHEYVFIFPEKLKTYSNGKETIEFTKIPTEAKKKMK